MARALVAWTLAVAASCAQQPQAGPGPAPRRSPGTSPVAGAAGTSGPRSTPSAPRKGPGARVVRVVDGDTVEVRFRGKLLTVRLIGVDTPETVHPFEPVECFGRAASRFTRRSLEGRAVRLEFDVQRVDRYGRTLAYVWLGEELFNETLVARGFARVATFPPNVRYVDRFRRAERRAQEADRGLWGGCPPEAGPSGGGGGGPGGCDPSYPGVCIAPPPPDLDCADVPYRSFAVRGPDPHRFDGDGDGIGCET